MANILRTFLALLLFASVVEAATFYDYGSGEFLSISTYTVSGTSVSLQALTVSPGTFGYCSGCVVPCAISTGTINAFVQCTSTMSAQ